MLFLNQRTYVAHDGANLEAECYFELADLVQAERIADADLMPTNFKSCPHCIRPEHPNAAIVNLAAGVVVRDEPVQAHREILTAADVGDVDDLGL